MFYLKCMLIYERIHTKYNSSKLRNNLWKLHNTKCMSDEFSIKVSFLRHRGRFIHGLRQQVSRLYKIPFIVGFLSSIMSP